MTSFKLFYYNLIGKFIWRRFNTAAMVIGIIFFLLALSIGIAEYYGFWEFFKILDELPGIKTVMIHYAIYTLFAFIFSLIIASSLIINQMVFLDQKETIFLISLPIRSSTIFQARFWRQILMNSWTIIIFGLPAILALGNYQNSSVGYYFLTITLLILLIILATALSNVLIFLTMIFRKGNSPIFTWIFIFIILSILGYLLALTITPHNLMTLLASENPEGNPIAINNLVAHFRFWPSSWFSDSLLSNNATMLLSQLNLYYFILLTFFILLIQRVFSQYLYRPILQASLSRQSMAFNDQSILRKLTGPTAQVYKEWLIFRRNRADITQFVLFIFLFVLYISFLFRTPSLSEKIDPQWTPRIILFIIMTTSYFIALLALRFAFPFAGLEKQYFWYALTLPKLRQKSYHARLFIVTLVTILLVEIIVLFTSIALHLPPDFTLPLAILVPFITLALVSFALAMGAMFPSHHKMTPEAMSTTVAGLLTVFGSIAYTAYILWGMWPDITHAVSSGLIGINMGPFYKLCLLISIELFGIFWILGLDKFQRSRLDQ